MEIIVIKYNNKPYINFFKLYSSRIMIIRNCKIRNYDSVFLLLINVYFFFYINIICFTHYNTKYSLQSLRTPNIPTH